MKKKWSFCTSIKVPFRGVNGIILYKLYIHNKRRRIKPIKPISDDVDDFCIKFIHALMRAKLSQGLSHIEKIV